MDNDWSLWCFDWYLNTDDHDIQMLRHIVVVAVACSCCCMLSPIIYTLELLSKYRRYIGNTIAFTNKCRYCWTTDFYTVPVPYLLWSVNFRRLSSPPPPFTHTVYDENVSSSLLLCLHCPVISICCGLPAPQWWREIVKLFFTTASVLLISFFFFYYLVITILSTLLRKLFLVCLWQETQSTIKCDLSQLDETHVHMHAFVTF